MRVTLNFLIEVYFKVEGTWLHNADLKNTGCRHKFAPNSCAASSIYPTDAQLDCTKIC